MSHRLTHILVLTLFLSTALTQPIAAAPAYIPSATTTTATAASCASLTSLSLPNTTVNSATYVPPASPTPGYCAVKLTVNNPPSSDAIRVGVFLPDNWNGRFQGLGGAVYAGGFPDFPNVQALQAGYATAATDTGHAGSPLDGSFALNPDNTLNWQLINDFSFLGIHEMTVAAKAVIAAYYGSGAQFSYFNGCSTGGRQGLMEAQRYPTDYNGIFSASPAINWDQFIPAELWGEVAMNLAHDFIPQCKFAAANQAAVAACDGLDGVIDGIIGDWQECHFDARTLIGTVTACGTITAADADIINKIWKGPRDSHGRFLWFGLLPGASFSGLDNTLTVGNVTTPLAFPIATSHFMFWLAQNPSFDWKTMSLDQYVDLFHHSEAVFKNVIGTSNPDLSAFRKAGGKIVSWHGTYDQLIFPQGSINYYARVVDEQDGLEKTRQFFRFFIAPGVAHCGGGAGAAPVDKFGAGVAPTDSFGALVDWVENHHAPDTLLGVKTDSSGNVVMTRPVCQFGENLVYKGHGSTNEAKNFVCKPFAADFHPGDR